VTWRVDPTILGQKPGWVDPTRPDQIPGFLLKRRRFDFILKIDSDDLVTWVLDRTESENYDGIIKLNILIFIYFSAFLG
jgi:hypothetical protein